ncbi:hypothetical protein VTK73DRAFT_6285 [Phialemonium thermophilum]|uniref:T6SS Phospholipase effector Tle1-like catalytic domain-containing protein n=1 Tax=Phialemonium thermophilum TaxID=223376 RepID=A0ABR3UZR9_9PEZI
MSVDERADRAASRRKRIIVCCDGTWMDSLGDDGDEPPSNVTRITRVLRRTGSDGTPQFITYFPGIGTSDALDRLVGGVFGTGLDKDIREAYNVLCTNYVDGDDIVLVGFSRGAFTARSVADMVASVGLLTPAGMASFQAVFDDYENMGEPGRDPADYLVPGLPAYGGEKGERKQRWEAERMRRYKLGLKQVRARTGSQPFHPHPGAGRLGHRGIAGHPAGARRRHPRLC